MGLFKTNPPETFPATMILVGQGREETLKAVCKHHARDDYFAMIERATKGEVSPEQVVMDLLASWEADEELSADTLRQMKANGHCPHMSHPDETIALIKEYLSSELAAR